MNDLDNILRLFPVQKSGNQAWKEYHETYPRGLGRTAFYDRLTVLESRGDLKRKLDGYERPNKAADFWTMLYNVSNWFDLEQKDRLTAQYLFHAVGNRDTRQFIEHFRALMDEHNVLATLEFLKTLYEQPKLGLSYIEMQWDMDDPDQSTRQGLLQAVRETFEN